MVAALVAAAARTGVGHTEAISAVESALAALASRDMNSKVSVRIVLVVVTFPSLYHGVRLRHGKFWGCP